MIDDSRIIIVGTAPVSVFAAAWRDRAISLIEGKDNPYPVTYSTWEEIESHAADRNKWRAERSLYYNQLMGDRSEWDTNSNRKHGR